MRRAAPVRRPRVLVAIPVYGGGAFVPRCITSAALLDHDACDPDVLVLDDCSPVPGWSERLAEHCTSVGAHYYRNPVNVGIVRNYNLAFRTGVEDGYDYVLTANSDTILAASLLSALLAAAQSDPAIGSVTAWGNNVSFCSIPNQCTEDMLSDPGLVDWIGARLRAEFGSAVLEVPAATGSAMLVPTSALNDVGYLDTVFDRGYCEETDWTRRSMVCGYRAVLALGAFAYHIGSVSARAAGLLQPGETSVASHEAIIDLRYPGFRAEIDAFVAGQAIAAAGTRAVRSLISSAIAAWGCVLDAGTQHGSPPPAHGPPLCRLDPARPTRARVTFRGFTADCELTAGGAGEPTGTLPPASRLLPHAGCAG